VDAATQQRHAALHLANSRRHQIALTKQRLRTGDLPLATVMRTQPELLADVALIDIVRWAYVVAKRPRAIERLGRQAVIDGVNLMVPLGRASARSRAWVAQHALRNWRPGTK
jgi:hypothetical protein